jgi:hypothetical protein
MDVRERLAQLERGSSPAWPIPVSSAAVVEVRTKRLHCPSCGGEYRLHEHVAVKGLRRVDVACRQCSRPRALWFRLVETEPN